MFLKHPEATLDYRMDWRQLLRDGVSIADSQWHVWPGGSLAVATAGIEGPETICRLDGGEAGSLYAVENRVGLTDGTSDVRALIVRVERG